MPGALYSMTFYIQTYCVVLCHGIVIMDQNLGHQHKTKKYQEL